MLRGDYKISGGKRASTAVYMKRFVPRSSFVILKFHGL
jgi:hypothetical protein